VDPTGAPVWGFSAVEGLGVAAAAGAQTLLVSPGGSVSQKVTSDWKVITNAGAADFGMVGRWKNAATGFYFARLRGLNSFRLSEWNGAVLSDLGTQAVTAVVENEILRISLEASVGASQSLVANYSSRAKVSNTPGAAAYNLTLVADPCTLRLVVDGVNRDVVFASGDALVVANGGLAALTNAGVAAVINNQFGTVCRAWVPAATTFVIVSSLAYGTSGSMAVGVAPANNANAQLVFPVAAAVLGDAFKLNAFDATLPTGFWGICGGFSGNSACWCRNYTVELT
jgi:hypothetical protein